MDGVQYLHRSDMRRSYRGWGGFYIHQHIHPLSVRIRALHLGDSHYVDIDDNGLFAATADEHMGPIDEEYIDGDRRMLGGCPWGMFRTLSSIRIVYGDVGSSMHDGIFLHFRIQTRASGLSCFE